MKRIEVLNKEISELSSRLEEKVARLQDIEASRNLEIREVVERCFASCLTDGVTISGASTSSIKFCQPDPGYINGKEVLSIYFRNEDWGSTKIYKVEPSFYTTNDSSEFELKRMVLIGRVGEVLLSSSDTFISEFNQVIEKYEEENKTILKERFKLDKDIVSKEKEVETLELEQLLEKAKGKGISIEGEELPAFDAKWDCTYLNVTGIRIDRITPSGKSADVEVRFMNRTYAGDLVDDRKHLITGVRMNNIHAFLKMNKNNISA